MIRTKARRKKDICLLLKRLPQPRACPTRDKIVVRVAHTIYPYSLDNLAHHHCWGIMFFLRQNRLLIFFISPEFV